MPAPLRVGEFASPRSSARYRFTTDLATGWPIEHGPRRSLVAVRLGAELGLDAAELNDAYYVALLGSVGCTIEATLFARYTADDIEASSRTAAVDFTSPLTVTAFAVRTFGSGQPPFQRARSLVSAAISGNAEFQAVCRDVAVRVGDMLDIGASIQEALAQCHERWNGQGGPGHLRGEAIRLAARIFHVRTTPRSTTRASPRSSRFPTGPLADDRQWLARGRRQGTRLHQAVRRVVGFRGETLWDCTRV